MKCYYCLNCSKDSAINATSKECLPEEKNCYIAELTALGRIEQNCASEIGFLFSNAYLQPAHVCSTNHCNVQLKEFSSSTVLIKSTKTVSQSSVSTLTTTILVEQIYNNTGVIWNANLEIPMLTFKIEIY
ncbi:hypothetical protein BpHYR1_004834 [Brachionus plicatilis]|uniref:Uncharacterized protein n=1 Tax=Brachionus plicatilis TaxID=10195 RepID=A0A3M7QMU4_BRAPC|nr:hypothetical protein BpHYR1_004834 [Brachionus plicatilis]